ncbi:MAG: ROK family protein [Pseudomonadota bacterium]
MASAPTLLVADLGGTSMKIGAVVDGVPQAIHQRVASSNFRTRDPLGAMADVLSGFASEHRLSPEAVVMTVPGFVDRDFDHALYVANIPELNGLAVASGLSARLGKPVMLERDAVLLLQGEQLQGAAQGQDCVLGIFFGTGVGAAFIDDGEVFRGAGWALEIGHMPIHGDAEPLDGLKADSLEVYASGRRLNALADHHAVAVEDLFRPGGPPALQADLDLFVRDQAFATASAMLMLCPKALVLGGGILDMAGYPRDALVRQIRERATLPPSRALDVRFAQLGWRAALHASARLVSERLSAPAHSPSIPQEDVLHAR